MKQVFATRVFEPRVFSPDALAGVEVPVGGWDIICLTSSVSTVFTHVVNVHQVHELSASMVLTVRQGVSVATVVEIDCVER